MIALSPITDFEGQAGKVVKVNDAEDVLEFGEGGGGSSLDLEVEGTPNADQTLLNLVAGDGIEITDNGSGEVEIAATGGGGGVTTGGGGGGGVVVPLTLT